MTPDLLDGLIERRNSEALLAEFPERGERLTFASAYEASSERAAQLERGGVGRGDCVLIVLGSEPDLVATWLAAQMLRAIAVVVDPQLTRTALDELVQRTRPRVAVTADEGVVALPNARPRLVEPGTGDAATDPSDLGTVLFTGGTSGRPKGILLSRHFMWAFTNNWLRSIGVESRDVHLLDLPYCHANGLLLGLGGSLLCGRPCIVYERFSASRYWDRVERAQATTASWIGGMAGILTKQPIPAAHSLERILCIPRPADAAAAEAQFRVHLVETWGSTEAGIAAWNDPETLAPGFGRVREPYAIEVRGENGAALDQVGAVGEMVVTASLPLWMCSGFWRDTDPDVVWPALTSQSTGDLIEILPGERFGFVGRRDMDLIRHRGHNVAATTVENAALEHADVLGAAAIGVAAEIGEQDVLLAYTVRDGARLEEPELLRFLTARLARFEVPRYLTCRPELPETVKHTVRKGALGALQETAWDAVGAGAAR